MNDSRFVYVIYILTTPQKLWEALTKPEFNRQYWFGFHQESGWQPGSPWKLVMPDGRVADAGEVVASDPPTRLVLKWRNEFRPELKAEGYTRCTFEIEPEGEMAKLTVTHEAENSHLLIERVSVGWPKILSSLKSLLETGRALPRTEDLPKGN